MIPLTKLSQSELEYKAPQLDFKTYSKLVDHINDQLQSRDVPYYIYVHPDLENVAQATNSDPRGIYLSLNFLAGYVSSRVKHELIFTFDEEIYKLQEADIEELKNTKRFHNPYNPKEVYENAEELIRRAFIILVG